MMMIGTTNDHPILRDGPAGVLGGEKPLRASPDPGPASQPVASTDCVTFFYQKGASVEIVTYPVKAVVPHGAWLYRRHTMPVPPVLPQVKVC